MTDDAHWMARALALAERGRGAVEPNPLVGAVVVRDGQIVGEGWHARFGGHHAEVHALDAAGEAARGATLYVTLEPCCHHGKTPPCTDAVLQAGVARVVAAMPDPFPQVAGEGAERLRRAGVTVAFGVGEAEVRRLNAPYLKLLSTGMPYVHLKWAMTLDGKIATHTGDSKWISNETSRDRVHKLRGRVDAILVGIGTALADDPHLTARPPGPRTATRIVLDGKCRLSPTSYLARTAREVPTLIATTAERDEDNATALQECGCEVLALPTERGRVSIPALLKELGQRRFTNVLVEGGGEVLGGFLDAGAGDEVHVFIAPRLAGGAGAHTPVAGQGVSRIADALVLTEHTVEVLDGDVYVHGRRAPIGSGP
jgi:diaminohydroxyphosphoribosylaminopyrimidine deaminase/5-amino-6-(5-phosphoribosylamino)uracil reductase